MKENILRIPFNKIIKFPQSDLREMYLQKYLSLKSSKLNVFLCHSTLWHLLIIVMHTAVVWAYGTAKNAAQSTSAQIQTVCVMNCSVFLYIESVLFF
ncbi:hypothetical protein STEG23_007222, partial [Scotinomys teguina]